MSGKDRNLQGCDVLISEDILSTSPHCEHGTKPLHKLFNFAPFYRYCEHSKYVATSGHSINLGRGEIMYATLNDVPSPKNLMIKRSENSRYMHCPSVMLKYPIDHK